MKLARKVCNHFFFYRETMRVRRRHLQSFSVDFHLAAGKDRTCFICRAGEYRLLDDVSKHVVLNFETDAVFQTLYRRKVIRRHGKKREIGRGRLDLADVFVDFLGDCDGFSGQASNDFLHIASR